MDAQRLLGDLNEAQRQAVEASAGPILVLAGAGSGKTRVITHRIGHLLASGCARPEEVLALTFTNKAAGEMRERVERLLGERPEGLWIGTFHALGVRILRREADRIGYPRSFQIYDGADQLALMKECLREIGASEENFPPASILSRVSAAKSARQSPAQVPRQGYLDEIVARAYEVYQRRLKSAGAFDFDDLILRSLEIFDREPALARAYSERVRYLLVDEYQDTDHSQYLLVRALSAVHGNVCVVGDEDQSIYGWRGADIRNILDFERDFPSARVIKLEKNYRSTAIILDAASAVISNNRSRIGKRLYTDNPRGGKIEHLTAMDDLEEARAVVGQIEALRRGAEPEECAVLYRTNSQSRTLEEALVARGVPYRVVGALRFYDRKEVKDLLAYLKLTFNPDDEVSLGRVLNVPPRAIGKVAEAGLEALAKARGVSIGRALDELTGAGRVDSRAGAAAASAALPARSHEALAELAALVRGWRDELETLTVEALVARIVRDTRYADYLQKAFPGDAEERRANLEELGRAAESAGSGREGVQFFLERTALVADTDDLEGEGGVTLLTLHSAKGLEFPVVFIVGMEERLFPHARALDAPEEVEEERRLCYVGFTRARRRLILCHALRRLVHGVPLSQEPSRFLSEIPVELIEEVWAGPRMADSDPTRRRRGAGGGGARRPAERTRWAESRGSGGSDTAPAGVVFGAARWGGEEEGGAFPPGARVEHPKFGCGQVEMAEGSGERLKLTIRFQKVGRKKILPHYAALRRIGVALLGATLAAFLISCRGGAGDPPFGESGAAIDGEINSADGVPIHYHAEGRGEPALVFVHGWSCDSTYWDAQTRYFSSLHRVVTIDLGGHGRSGLGRGEWTIAAFARDVEAVVKKLDVKRMVLLGHSMGGAVALEAARLMPERVVALLPVDTLHDAEAQVDDAELQTILQAMEKDFKETTNQFVRGMFPENADPALITRIAADMSSAPPEVAISAIRSGVSYDPRDSLRALKIPIHAISSEKYPLKLEVNRRYAPQFQVTVLPGTGHFPMLEATAEFNRAVEAVIAALPSGSPQGPAAAAPGSAAVESAVPAEESAR